MVFWYNDGWLIYIEFESYVCKKFCEYGYDEVKGLLMMDCLFWEKLGYWDKYVENMFMIEFEKCEYVVKLMNCLGYV